MHETEKLGSKSYGGVLIGYAQNSSSQRFLMIKPEVSDISPDTTEESNDASFSEDAFQ